MLSDNPLRQGLCKGDRGHLDQNKDVLELEEDLAKSGLEIVGTTSYLLQAGPSSSGGLAGHGSSGMALDSSFKLVEGS
jgi:hypothetical protein